MVLKAERGVGAADEFRLRRAQFRQRGVTRDSRGRIRGEIGTILNQVQQDQVGGRVSLPPSPVGAGPGEGPWAARPNSVADFAGSVTTDRFNPNPRPTQ